MSALIHEKSMKFTTSTQVRYFFIIIYPNILMSENLKIKLSFLKVKNLKYKFSFEDW